MKDPGRVIETKRLYLRQVSSSDVGEQYHSWLNDPEVTQYLEIRHSPQSMEEISEFVTAMAKNRNILFLAICLKKIREHIGNIKLGPINPIHRFAEVSLLIGNKHCWKKGYASEAITALAEFAFGTLNLNRLFAGFYDENIGSIKAFKNSGFKKEGVFRKMRYFNGRYVDQVMMGRVKGE